MQTNNIFTNPIIIEKRDKGEPNYLARALFKMMIGLLITGITSYACIRSGAAMKLIYGMVRNQFGMMLLIVAIYFMLNVFLFRFVRNRNASTLAVNSVYATYSVFEGLCISPIVMFSTGSNIATAFFSSAALFAFLAMIAVRSKDNYMKISNVLAGAFVAIFFAAILNMIFRSSLFSFILSVICVVVCSVAICHDVQWAKMVIENVNDTHAQKDKISTMAAMMLHVNIVNLFVHILRILSYIGGSGRGGKD